MDLQNRITLRDGSTTFDPRLDRIVQFDHRSRLFGASDVVPVDAPLKTRVHLSRIWLDQGREGACVSFSWHTCMATSPKSVLTRIDNASAKQRYYIMQQDDDWPGGEYPGASPVYSGTSVLAGAKLMQSLGFFPEYRWAFGIDELLAVLSHEGPAVLGIPWFDSMMDTDSNGMLTVEPDNGGAGHAICARAIHVPHGGYVETTAAYSKRRIRIKTSEPLVRFRNTWWRDWGLDGECFVRASDLDTKLLTRQGESCVPMRNTPRS
jgi:hypothetical protein